VKFATRAIHVGQGADPTTGATIVPIYQTSTYTQDAIGVHKGYDYSRSINPTRVALEAQLASLEDGAFGSAFSSGVAATAAALSLVDAGRHVVVSDDLYGGTYRLFSRVLSRYGIEFTYVDMTDLEAVRSAMRPATRMIWIETPTNPMLKLVDIAAIGGLRDAHARASGSARALVCVDNTFCSPYFQRPLALGADIVVHSTTKYIGGHSDVIGGVTITNDPGIADAIKFHQNSAGAVPGPQDVFLTMRGAKTLAVRMREHAKNAQAVAEFLESRDDVERVYYPGLPSHAQYELAKKQMRGFGGMVSFVPSGGVERAHAFAPSLMLFSLAESLGGVESLISNPARMTHGAIPKEERERRGVVDGLLRLSVGIEDVEDLIEDLRAGLDATRPVLSTVV
jgi:cystathionine gamma-synthase/cystathionine gamma-lyase